MNADIAAEPIQSHHRANLITTVIGFMFSIVTGLWFTPYLVHRLGPSVYGLLPLATTIVSYFSLLSQTLSAALTRNLSLTLGQGDQSRTNRVFGTILTAASLICFALLIPLAVTAVLAPRMFDIPPGMGLETQILFAVVALSFLMSLISICFTAVSFSVNQIYLNNIANMVQTLSRIAFTVLAFQFVAPRVFYAAVAIFLAAILSLALNVLFAKRSLPWLRMSGFAYDGEVFRGVYRTSSHQLVMQFGTVIIMSCEIVLVNRLFGHYDSGRYAVVIQWTLLLRNATVALVVLFVPTMLSYYARHDIDGLVRYARRAMRWVGLCVALPAGYLCGLSPQILTVWVGPEFANMWPIMCVQLAPLVIVSAVVPLYTISLAADRVLPSGIVQLLTSLVAIGLAIVSVQYGGFGMIAIALAVGWTLLAKELAFMPIYTARNIKRSPATFYPALLSGVAMFALALMLSWLAGRVFALHSYLALGLVGVGVSIPYAIVALAILGAEDRSILINAVPAIRRRPAAPAA